ncbi:MAG TPA: hypothetical protein VHK69_13925 [Chitinophagaceae bacterium]|jgi:hypothetical protein|nr:hypothetical protein [Chitinophagaceae bacterium]
MRPFFLFLLLATGSSRSLFAQTEASSPLFRPAGTEALFHQPSPGTLPYRYIFLLRNGNRMSLELSHPAQLGLVADPDSLARQAWNDLSRLSDSLGKPLVSRRIDMVIGEGEKKVRMLEYPQRADVFRIKGDDIAQLKTEQDTLRMHLFTDSKSTGSEAGVPQPYFLQLELNNLSDLSALGPRELEEALQLLREDKAPKFEKQKLSIDFSRHAVVYDARQRKRVTAQMLPPKEGSNRAFLRPYFQVALQYGRGAWLPSAGAGLEIEHHAYTNSTRQYKLVWEPYFLFGTQGEKLATRRNDFLTFKYSYLVREARRKELLMATQVSLGYLIHRSGTFFERHTFKASVPGLQTKNLLLEPEFFFNGLFKNVSPSLKLSLSF